MEYIISEKNGQKITTRMLQDKLLIILKEIDRVCQKNNIDYFLSDGTCLGAVRHHGFIPWDDDADIAMSREDFKRFIKALDKDLGPDFVYHCYEKSKDYIVTWPAMKIRLKNSYIKDKIFLLQNKCKDSNGIFVDVFIYDHMAASPILDFPLRTVNTLLLPPIVLFENMYLNPIPLKSLYRFNARFYGKLCAKSPYYADDLTWTFNPIKPYKMKYTDIYPTKRIKFEDVMLPVPGNTHNYLVAKYGKNYMTPPPEHRRVGYHIKDVNLNSSEIITRKKNTNKKSKRIINK